MGRLTIGQVELMIERSRVIENHREKLNVLIECARNAVLYSPADDLEIVSEISAIRLAVSALRSRRS